MSKVWVLTTEHNDYNQHGAYFVAVFQKKPSLAKLAEWFANNENISFPSVMAGIAFLEHLLSGGGRKDSEDQWYILEEVGFEDD